MKVGILTFHDGPNHGAFLQAWATFRSLADAGHDVEVINYKNARHHQMDGGGGLRVWKNPLAALRACLKRGAFRKAHRHFNLGPFVMDPEVLRQRHFDAVVVGSDVVWNYKLFGYDPVFFGRVNADRRIAFSASFGTVVPEDAHPAPMADDLRAFDAIAVRDRNSQEIVRRATGREAEITLDPALIYDYRAEVASAMGGDAAGDLVFYSFLKSDAVMRAAAEYATEHGLKIVFVGYPPSANAPRRLSRVRMTCGPFEWVERFARAHTIFTSTFHGVVFSLKSRKPFFFVSSDKTHNRVSSLLDFCGIAHDLKLGEPSKIRFFEPDYAEVTPKLEAGGEASRQWLLQQL